MFSYIHCKFDNCNKFTIISEENSSKTSLIKNTWSENFLNYLTGLIEGDGTIIVPNSGKGKNYPSIEISFHSHDLSLALAIQAKLGFGSISKTRGVNAYRLTINSNIGILSMVEILNGRMKTAKIHSLNKLINWINEDASNKLVLKPLDIKPLDSTSWLSGFVEADGHFSVRASKPNSTNKYGRVECQFELEQAQFTYLGHSTLDCLNNIAKLFKTTVKETKSDTKFPKYRVKTTSLIGNLEVEKYFEKFPLFGTKHLNYKDWLQVLQVFKNSQSYDKKFEIAQNLRDRMNDNRKEFTWNHLQNFY